MGDGISVLCIILTIIIGGWIGAIVYIVRGLRSGRLHFVTPNSKPRWVSRDRTVPVFRSSDGRSDGHVHVSGSHVGAAFR
ncbi:protein of unknown function [Paraburkholderia kururiensis]|uniref:hypothetical protein n=1 Tax=Paraburkholderia kururiensis TaxID=984307 RepID=UPI0039A72B37